MSLLEGSYAEAAAIYDADVAEGRNHWPLGIKYYSEAEAEANECECESDFDYDSFDENSDYALYPPSDEAEAERDLLTYQNTLYNSLPLVQPAEAAAASQSCNECQSPPATRHLLKCAHQADGHDQADATHGQQDEQRQQHIVPRLSHNGRSIVGAVDSVTLYAKNALVGKGSGSKPKYPERRRHSSNHSHNNNNNHSSNDPNPPPSAPPVHSASNGTGSNERTSQQRIEEPPIEVIGHVPTKPIMFPRH